MRIPTGSSSRVPLLADKKLYLVTAVRDDLPALPGSLESALAAFRADGKLRAGLGESFSDYFAVSREWELKAWRESVSDWERERYERAV